MEQEKEFKELIGLLIELRSFLAIDREKVIDYSSLDLEKIRLKDERVNSSIEKITEFVAHTPLKAQHIPLSTLLYLTDYFELGQCADFDSVIRLWDLYQKDRLLENEMNEGLLSEF